MGSYSYSPEAEPPISIRSQNPNPSFERKERKKKPPPQRRRRDGAERGRVEGEVEEADAWPRRKGNGGVMLEGYVVVDGGDRGEQGSDGDGVGGGEGVGRTKSLTDEDLEELKGCLDLGFGFSYEEIPELCNTLPALELCYSMSQRFLDEHQHQQQQSRSPEAAGEAAEPCASSSSPSPIANWKISSPGDHPEDVKARLKYWAQAVACTVRLCS